MLLLFLGGLGVALYTERGRCRAWSDLRTWAGRTRAAGNGGREGLGSWGFLLGVALGVALYTERGAAALPGRPSAQWMVWLSPAPADELGRPRPVLVGGPSSASDADFATSDAAVSPCFLVRVWV